ncbi:MAG: hypothetical protein ACRDKX_03555 [Solirubrobacterales bacterium]
MQDRLFDQHATTDTDEDDGPAEVDPYEDVRRAGERLAAEFAVEEERATDMVLSFGSEAAARRVLVQRWLLGEEHSKAA